MGYTDSKINNFRNCVLIDAKKQRDEILCEAENYENAQKQAAEKEIFSHIYDSLQQCRIKLEKEAGEKISEASEKCRRSIIAKREEITDKVFEQLRERIEEIRTTDKYKVYLENCIKEAADAVGEGKIKIFADKRDEAAAKKIAQNMGAEFETGDILGGCRVINTDKGIVCSNALSEKLERLRESFFELADLSI